MKKKLIFYGLFVISAVFVIPVVAALISSRAPVFAASVTEARKGEDVYVIKTDGGEKTAMDRPGYIICVTAAALAPDCPDEGIKAVAVAAQTLARYRAGENTEKDYDITAAEQVFLTPDEAGKKWGGEYERLKKCVKEVENRYLADGNGKTALALHHHVSPGRTSSAKDIFGIDLPYLQSVDCSCDLLSGEYLTVNEYTHEEFGSAFADRTALDGDEPKKWIGDYDTLQNGWVRSVSVGGDSYTGEEIRDMFSLPSAAFDAVITDSEVILRVRGQGHSVGMSEYGAYSLALQGENYRAVLGYFYPGCKLIEGE